MRHTPSSSTRYVRVSELLSSTCLRDKHRWNFIHLMVVVVFCVPSYRTVDPAPAQDTHPVLLCPSHAHALAQWVRYKWRSGICPRWVLCTHIWFRSASPSHYFLSSLSKLQLLLDFISSRSLNLRCSHVRYALLCSAYTGRLTQSHLNFLTLPRLISTLEKSPPTSNQFSLSSVKPQAFTFQSKTSSLAGGTYRRV